MSNPLLLATIYLLEGHLVMARDFDPFKSGQKLKGIFNLQSGELQINTDENKASKVAGEAARVLLRKYRFSSIFLFRYTKDLGEGVEGPEQESNAPFVAEISATIVAEYGLREGNEPNEQELQIFSHTAVFSAVWPYWREYFNSSLARLNLPSSPLPLLNPMFEK